MAVACATLGPFIRPSGRGDYASVFRPLLICHADMEVGGGVDFAFEALLEERGLEFGKIHTQLKGIFHISVVEEPIEIAAERFVCAAHLR